MPEDYTNRREMNKLEIPFSYWRRHVTLFNLLVCGAGIICLLALRFIDILWIKPVTCFIWIGFVNMFFLVVLLFVGLLSGKNNSAKNFLVVGDIVFWWVSIVLAILTAAMAAGAPFG